MKRRSSPTDPIDFPTNRSKWKCHAPLLWIPKPPDSGEGPILPLKALAEGFEVTFTKDGILWVFPRVGKRHEDHPPSEGLERGSIDACETPEEVSAACPG